MLYYTTISLMKLVKNLSRLIKWRLHGRQLLSAAGAAFLLATIAFSSLFVAFEADHDCDGADCPVCQEIQSCVSNFQLLGGADGCADAPTSTFARFSAPVIACAYRAPATTLQSIYVRFNE